MKKLYTVFFLLFVYNLLGQNNIIDSLKIELVLKNDEITRIDLYTKLAHEFNQINIDSSILYANRALIKLAEIKEDSLSLILSANAYNALGIAFNNKGDFENAILNFENAIECDAKCNNTERVAEKLLNLGIIHKSLGNYSKALELYDSSLNVAMKKNYQNLYTMTKVNMGVLNYEIGDFDNALSDYYEALKLKREEGDFQTVAILIYNIGLIFDEKQDYKSANENYTEALELFRQKENLYGQAYCLSCIGSNYVKTKDYMQAIDYYNKAYSIHEKLENKQGMGESFGEIGTIYLYNKKYRKAKEFYDLALQLYNEIGYLRGEITILQRIGELYYEQKNYAKALRLFSESLFKADSLKDKPQLKNAYEYMASTYYKIGNYKQAYESHLRYVELKDTIFNKEVDDNITKLKAQHDVAERENEISILKNEQDIRDLRIKKQQFFIFSFIIGLFIILIFLLVLFNKNKKIRQAKDKLTYQKKQITDSIEYASKIQTAILPPDEYITQLIPDHFIFYKPRDIVSGDFYWVTEKNDKIVIAVVDCTGHGVPGAFMSMLGIAFLNEIVNSDVEQKANIILNRLRVYIKKSLHQTGKDYETKDGMDISLCVLDKSNGLLQFAGAYNSLFIISKNQSRTIKGDRMPIGIYRNEKKSFTNHEIKIYPGDMLYMFTDGYIDQFGGKNKRKFRIAPFKELIVSIHKKTMYEQKKILKTKFDAWKGPLEQIDDVLVFGFRI